MEMKDLITGKVYKNRQGRFSVPGGTVYQVKMTGYPVFELPVISGEKREIVLSEELVFIEKLFFDAGNVEIVLCNLGSKKHSVQVNAFADNARIGKLPAVSIGAGEKKVVKLPVAAVNKALAAAAAFYIGSDFRNALSILIK